METFDSDNIWTDEEKQKYADDPNKGGKALWKTYSKMSPDPSVLFTNLIEYLPSLCSHADGHVLIFYRDGDELVDQMRDPVFNKYNPKTDNQCDNIEAKVREWADGIVDRIRDLRRQYGSYDELTVHFRKMKENEYVSDFLQDFQQALSENKLFTMGHKIQIPNVPIARTEDEELKTKIVTGEQTSDTIVAKGIEEYQPLPEPVTH